GMQIKLGDYVSSALWVRVVGVVRDRAEGRLKQYFAPSSGSKEIGDIYYLPSAREMLAVAKNGIGLELVVRATIDPQRMPVALRRELLGMPGAVYVTAASMEETLGIVRQRMRHEFVASLFALFA